MLTASCIKEALQAIYCSNEQKFCEIFGPKEDEGPHLWRKYQHELGRDVGRFVCELDSTNIGRLAAFVEKPDPSFLGNILDLGLD